jgi:alkylation response protein AidB-like acyl-CoA dehydrogenase
MNLALTEEQIRFQQVARDFLDKEVVPHRRQWDRAESVDLGIVPKLADVGFFGLTIPEEYGGIGGDYLTYCLGMEELGRADSSVRGIVSVSMGLVGKAVLSHGTPEQKQTWLPRIASGAVLACFGLTEPDTGSDAANLATRAVRSGAGYLISGHKMFITNGTWADVCLVFARTGGPGPKGVSAFLVPTDAPGFERREIRASSACAARQPRSCTCPRCVCPSRHFSALRARASRSRCGLSPRAACQSALRCLNEARFGIVFGALGAAKDCLDTAVSHCLGRTVSDRPLAAFQLTQLKLADMVVELGNGMLLAMHLGRLKDAGGLRPAQLSLGKLHNVRAALDIARQCRTLLGANGITLEYPVMRHSSNLESVLTYEGTSEIHSLTIGREITGLPAFT